MIASLACYDLPAIRPAVEDWWSGIARKMRGEGLKEVNESLYWPAECDLHWTENAFLLTQTCGYPLMTFLEGRFEVLATPCYGADGCSGPLYSSALIARADDARDGLMAMKDARVAVNGWKSHSGMNALRHTVAPFAKGERFFSEVIVSGGHFLSCRAVAEALADLAAVDAVTLALVAEHEPDLFNRLKVIGWSKAAPALPYVTSKPVDREQLVRMREALYEASADPSLASARNALLLQGFSVLPDGAYKEMLAMEREAQELGYGEIR